MNISNWKTATILGRGGTRPGVSAIDPTGRAEIATQTLANGESVYALARSPGGMRLAAGTKTGRGLLYTSNTPDGGEWAAERVLPHHGSAVLSVAFADDDTVIIANASGACWLFRAADSFAAPVLLDTHDYAFCALCRATTGEIVGLALDGCIAVCDLASTSFVGIAKGPVPTQMAALACLTAWGTPEVLVYPTNEGDLAAIDLNQATVSTRKTVHGPWLAAAVMAEQLITFGLATGQAQMWSPQLEAEPPLPCPSDVIGGAGLDDGRLLLVRQDGSAGIYTVQPNGITLQISVEGADYRSCLPVDLSAVHQARSDAAAEKARSIAGNALTQLGIGKGVEEQVAELRPLGYPHVAAVLQAEEAEKTGGLSIALSAYAELTSTLPTGAPEAQRVLAKYVETLTAAGLYDYALETSEGHTSEAGQATHSHLDSIVSALREDFSLIDGGPEVETVFECASAVGIAASGRWVENRMPPMVCAGLYTDATAVADKWSAVAKSDPQYMDAVSVVTATCISAGNGAVSRFNAAVLLWDDGPRLQLCLCCEQAGTDTVVTPVLVFHVPAPDTECTPTDHNALALQTYRYVRKDNSIRQELSAALARSKHVLRRVLTENATHGMGGKLL